MSRFQTYLFLSLLSGLTLSSIWLISGALFGVNNTYHTLLLLMLLPIVLIGWWLLLGQPYRHLMKTLNGLYRDPSVPLHAQQIAPPFIALQQALLSLSCQREYEQRLRLADGVFEYALEGILVCDKQGFIQSINPALAEMMGYSREELLTSNVRVFRSGRHDEGFYRQIWRDVARQGYWRGEIWNCRKNGEAILLRLSIAAILDDHGSLLNYVGSYTDITAEHRAAQTLAQAHLYHRMIISALGEGLYCVDRDGCLEFINPAAERMLGWAEDELLGRKIQELLYSGDEGTALSSPDCPLHKVLLEGGDYHGEQVISRRDGSHFPVECHVTPLYEDDAISGAVVVFTDISRRKYDEQRIHHMAYHDNLTGLANRTLLLEHMRLLIAQGLRHHHSLAVMFLDLNRFKQINDSLGHHIGDGMLVEVARRLRSILRKGDLLVRQGGDEFIIALANGHDETHDPDVSATTIQVAEKIHQVMAAPFLLDSHSLHISVSIGISCMPEHGHDADTLLRHADQAMYQAKQMERGTMIYAHGSDKGIQARLAMEQRLHGAIERQELTLLVQPVVALNGGHIVGGEALLRWQDEGRMIPPAEFIPVAEETGYIVPLGNWVIEEACRLLAPWRAQMPDFILAINLSPKQLQHPGLLRKICQAMKDHGIAHEALELEITETVTMSLPRRSRRSIRWLSKRGIRLSIDDFGTGHSSLLRLQEITADRIKIDRSFVADLGSAHGDSIVRNTISLGHDLGMSIIAEGVETPLQRQILTDMGCDYMQGYLFSHPLSPEAFSNRLSEHNENIH